MAGEPEPACRHCGSDDVRIARLDGEFGYRCRSCGEWSPPPSISASAPSAAADKAAASAGTGSRDPALLSFLVDEIARFDGVATTHDLRPVVEPRFPRLTHQDLSFHLIHLCDEARPPLLTRMFGHADDSAAQKSRAEWIRANRPDQPTEGNQVWQLVRPVETPSALRSRLKLGREEFCQRLLTSLILHGPYPRWNTPHRPSRSGLEFLRRLWALSFDAPWPGDDLQFVDEFELPPRTDSERGGAPDHAVLWPDLLWMIELKTERGSHRADQIPSYFDLGRHHHRDRQIWLTYLTPPADFPFSETEHWARYAHVTWPQAADIVRDVWGASDRADWADVARGLLEALDGLERPASEWRARAPDDVTNPVGRALELARQTAEDGAQRALEWEAPNLEALQRLRVDVREELAAEPSGSSLRRVRPWLWRPESSGAPRTAAGRSRGFELRLSRYDKDMYEA